MGFGLLAGCASLTTRQAANDLEGIQMRLFVPPFFNATVDEHAGRALTELTTTAILRRGIPLIQTEAALAQSRKENAAGPEGLYMETARSLQATHLLIGTVHEYRYKTDLDGNPAVGLTLRLVDATDGRTVWQDSRSEVGFMFASLSTVAGKAVRSLVSRIPF